MPLTPRRIFLCLVLPLTPLVVGEEVALPEEASPEEATITEAPSVRTMAGVVPEDLGATVSALRNGVTKLSIERANTEIVGDRQPRFDESGDSKLTLLVPRRTVHNGIMTSNQEDLVRAIAAEGVRDPRLLRALRAVPRAGFVPSDLAEAADLDRPLPIPHGQVTTQPSLSVKMIEALGLEGSECVLEVGTGYGFQTALLCRMSGFVRSVERFADIAETARDNLARYGIANVEVVVSDGTGGLPEYAPYGAILVSAAFPSVPPPLAEQLATGGRLVQPIGPGGREEVILFEKGPQGLERRRAVTGAHFVRLYGTHAFPAG